MHILRYFHDSYLKATTYRRESMKAQWTIGGHSGSFILGVIIEELYLVQYNNFGLISEGYEDIATENS